MARGDVKGNDAEHDRADPRGSKRREPLIRDSIKSALVRTKLPGDARV
jgi:hypothetical protein